MVQKDLGARAIGLQPTMVRAHIGSLTGNESEPWARVQTV